MISERPRKNGEKTTAVDRATVNQTPATAAPNIFFLIRRCLNGRKVVCIRYKEIAARFAIEASGKKYVKLEKTLIISKLLNMLIFQKLQSLPNNKLSAIKPYVTNMPATARLITMYMLCLRRIRSFRKIMIVRAFMVTIATASMLSTVSQAMHSDEEKSSKFGASFLFW